MPPVAACSSGSPDGEDEAFGDSGLSTRSLTASLPGETHTLGNVVRSLLIKNPDVEFAGYSVPHPTQVEMNLRIQTTEKPAIDALQQALDDLTAICDVMESKYDEAFEAFNAKNPPQQREEAIDPTA